MKSASKYWEERFGEEPKSDNDKLMCAMMREYAEYYQKEMQKALSLGAVSVSLPDPALKLAGKMAIAAETVINSKITTVGVAIAILEDALNNYNNEILSRQ